MNFPANFIWGASTSSYQIEGGWNKGGKGPSIWDTYCHKTGNIWAGHTGDTACDHFHRWKQDLELAADLKLGAYRFSISWPRVFPEGIGRLNKQGLDFYDRLVDFLLAKKIDPWITLYHWDYPQALQDENGWLNPESPRWFARYASAVVERLSDRVTNWSTLNEPQAFIGLGFHQGPHAPALNLGMKPALLAGHHVLLAHGLAVQAIRAHARRKPTVGWAASGFICCPMTEDPVDIEAARRVTLRVSPENLWNNCWWGDAALLGHYPEDGLRAYGSDVPKFKSSDFDIICQPMDLYCCNLFTGIVVRADKNGDPSFLSIFSPDTPITSASWRIQPDCLYWGSRFLSNHYKLPVVISENGMASCDFVSLDGQVHDVNRIDFMNRHLLQVSRAIQDRIDIRGYFAWSLLDNFEWQEGYRHRYGLIYVNFESQERILKDSAIWYRDIIASKGARLDDALIKNNQEIPYLVKAALHYIRTHIEQPFLVKDIAKHLSCHPDFLGWKFKKYLGKDLSQYIRTSRVNYAKELLKNPKFRIGEVADRSGFKDHVNFGKVFRRITGMTPSQFREDLRNNAASSSASLQNPRSYLTA